MDADVLRTKYLPSIVKHLDIIAIIPHLIEEKLVTRDEQEDLLNEYRGRDERIIRWVTSATKKGPTCISRFVECLRRSEDAGGHKQLLIIMGQSSAGASSTEIVPETAPERPFQVARSHSSRLSHPFDFWTKFISKFKDHLDPIAITPSLVTAGLLLKHEEEHLLNPHHSITIRMVNLAKNLSRRGQNAIPKFLTCLSDTKEAGGHKELLQEMRGELKSETSTKGLDLKLATPSPTGATYLRFPPIDVVCTSNQHAAGEQPSPTSSSYVQLYEQMISLLCDDLNVVFGQLYEATGLFLPCEQYSNLQECTTVATFCSLHSYLSELGLFNPIEIDSLIVLLTEVGMPSLVETLLNYAANIHDVDATMIVADSVHVTHPPAGYLFLYISHTNRPLTALNIWDTKEVLSTILMGRSSERGQFWFRGFSLDQNIIVWQFIAVHEQQVIHSIQTQCHEIERIATLIQMLKHSAESQVMTIYSRESSDLYSGLGKRKSQVTKASSCHSGGCKRNKTQESTTTFNLIPTCPSNYKELQMEMDSTLAATGDDSYTPSVTNYGGQQTVGTMHDDIATEDWKILLNSHASDIERLINITTLLPHLHSNDLLTCNQNATLMNPLTTESRKIQMLLLFLHNKGIDGYRRFLRAIEQETTHTGHVDLYKILTESKPSILPPTSLLIEMLKNKYTKPKWSTCVVSGPKPQNEFYVQLALIKKIRLNEKDKLTDKFLSQSLHGCVDDILFRKEVIELKCLFNGKPGKKVKNQFVLVEGAPGIGKTRLSCYLCTKWAEGELLQQYEFVIFVPLRRFQKNYDREFSLEDIIKLYLRSEKGKAASEELANNGCRNTLLILDGWDELPPKLREEDSFFHDIVSYNSEFSNVSVLVTSRCTVSSSLYDVVGVKRIEVLGFDSDHVNDYITSHIPDKKDMFLAHLDKFPNIRALLHIPLTLSIMCDILNDLDSIKCDTLPSTLTELYNIYILKKLFCGLKKIKPHLQGISSLSELPPEESTVFQSLCQLALRRFQKGRYVFKEKHLKQAGLAVKPGFDGYGLLSSFPCHVKAGNEICYQFRHLTIQEFLAGYCIAHLNEKQMLEVLNQHRLDPKFQVVWKFYAGITKLNNELAKRAIIYETKRYNNKDLMLLLHCVYEVQDPSICKDVACHLERELLLNNKTLNANDCLSIAYTLANASCEGQWALHMRGCNMGSSGLELLYEQVLNLRKQKSMKNAISISKLDLTCNYLHLPSTASNKPGGEVLSKFMETPFMVEKLILESNPFNDQQISVLAKAMCSNETITTLSIGRSTITATGAEYLADMLLQNKTLKGLFLRWNDIGDDGIAHLASALKVNSSLVELLVGDNGIGKRGFTCLCEMLKVNRGLTELRIEGTPVNYSQCHEIVEFMSHNRSLELLDLTKSKLGDAGVKILAAGLKQYRQCSLRKLHVLDCDISDDGVEILCELIDQELLKSLRLGCNRNITDKSVPNLMRVLNNNKTLEHLRLENCEISAKCQQELKSLKGIDITFIPNIHLDRSMRGIATDELGTLR